MTTILSYLTQATLDIGTLVVSLVSVIIAIIFGYKHGALSRRTVELEERLDKFNYKRGEILLASLIAKYFISFISSLDTTNPAQAKQKSDEASRLQQIRICNHFINELHNLSSNPFYIEILEKYPDIIKLEVAMVIRIKQLEVNTNNTSIDRNLYKMVYTLLKRLEKNKSSTIFETEIFKNMLLGLAQLNQQNPALLQ